VEKLSFPLLSLYRSNEWLTIISFCLLVQQLRQLVGLHELPSLEQRKRLLGSST
jgi:hypothetical protein